MEFIDLTHTFTNDMPVYPGDSAPALKQTSTMEQDDIVSYELHSGMHVGTHMDAPLHMLAGGKKLSEFSVDKFFGNGVLIDARGKSVVDVDLLNGADIQRGDIVLIMTGFYKKFREPEYYHSHPDISESFAKKMVELGVKIVGMDTPSPDLPALPTGQAGGRQVKAPFAIHKILLGAEVLIIENLTNLEPLLNHKKFEIIALPAKFEAEAAFARVVARILENMI